jgi:hypothetical protein
VSCAEVDHHDHLSTDQHSRQIFSFEAMGEAKRKRSEVPVDVRPP